MYTALGRAVHKLEADAWVDKERAGVLVLTLRAANLRLPPELLMTLVFECCHVNQYADVTMKHGLWRYWVNSGLLYLEERFVFGGRRGQSRMWYASEARGIPNPSSMEVYTPGTGYQACYGVAESLRLGTRIRQISEFAEDDNHCLTVSHDYHPNGQLAVVKTYLPGCLHGPVDFFNEDGTLRYMLIYKQGKPRVCYAQCGALSPEFARSLVLQGDRVVPS